MHEPPSVHCRGTVRRLWSQSLPAPLRGLALAREKACLLVWDQNHWLYLLNRLGERQGQLHARAPLTTACCAEDGSAFAAGGATGDIWWLAPDLSVRWQRTLSDACVAAAMDSFGQYLAVADSGGNLHIFDGTGRPVGQSRSPRPLHYLAFVPTAPRLIGSSDYGLVACFDLHATQLWRDALVIHAGALAVSGDGATIVLACFTEGLQRYTLAGKKPGRLPTPEPCRLASLSFDGRLLLVAGLSSRLLLLDGAGRLLHTHPLDRTAVALALAPLGDYAIAALKDGEVVSLDLSGLVMG
jgi:hypothetical protein